MVARGGRKVRVDKHNTHEGIYYTTVLGGSHSMSISSYIHFHDPVIPHSAFSVFLHVRVDSRGK